MVKDIPGLHGHIRKVILERTSQGEERRREALVEYLGVSMPHMDRAAIELLAQNAPPLLPALYEKWVFMFAKRLFETVPVAQIELLCGGTEEDDAAIILAYLMFLESERMEKQVEEDLKHCGLASGEDGEGAAAMADYIRGQLSRIEEDKTRERLDKAAAYRSEKAKGRLQ